MVALIFVSGLASGFLTPINPHHGDAMESASSLKESASANSTPITKTKKKRGFSIKKAFSGEKKVLSLAPKCEKVNPFTIEKCQCQQNNEICKKYQCVDRTGIEKCDGVELPEKYERCMQQCSEKLTPDCTNYKELGNCLGTCKSLYLDSTTSSYIGYNDEKVCLGLCPDTSCDFFATPPN